MIATEIEWECDATRLVSTLTIAARRLQEAVDQEQAEFSAAWRQLVGAVAAGADFLDLNPGTDPELSGHLHRLFAAQSAALDAVGSSGRSTRRTPDDIIALADDVDRAMRTVAHALHHLRMRLPISG
jgi:hypothetical protein